jgi:PAS domain S-box-containing protein
VPIELLVHLVKDSKGNPQYYYSFLTDITERKQAESLLHARRRLSMRLASVSSLDEALSFCLDMILDVSGIDCGGVYRVDPKTGDFDLLSSKGISESFMEKVSHLPADTSLGQMAFAGNSVYTTYAALEIPSDIRQTEALRAVAIVPIVQQGKLIACYNIASHKLDGISQTVQELLEAVVVERGNAITRILAEESLRESEQRFRTIFDSVNDSIFVHDIATGDILDVNPPMCAMCGYTREEALQLKMEDLRSGELPYTQKDALAWMNKVVEEGLRSLNGERSAKKRISRRAARRIDQE